MLDVVLCLPYPGAGRPCSQVSDCADRREPLVMAAIALTDGKFGAYMQVHIQNDGPVTIELESPAPGAAASDPKQLSKLEKQQQRKEKTRAKGPSESSKERSTPRKEDRSASSGAEGHVSLEREP